jgi:hypothetical protein
MVVKRKTARMTNNNLVLFDNRPAEPVKLCILISVRNDRGLFTLLEILKAYKRTDFHVCIANDLNPEPFIYELPAPLRGFILHHKTPATIATKFNSLIAAARGEWLATLETDTLPTKEWLDDVFKIIGGTEPDAVHLGGEIYAKPLNLNNVIFRKRAEIPQHLADTYYANDTGWFMACEKRGIPLVRHDKEALVFHDTDPMRGYMRFFLYAHDYAYLSAELQDYKFFRRKVMVECYYLLRGLVDLPALFIFFAFYSVKRLFFKK